MKNNTPWKFEKGTMTIRTAKENYWLASMNSFDGAVDNEANAEYIIKAVNSHETMLAALKDVQKAYQEMFSVMPVAFQTYANIVDEAITQAEKGA